MTTAPRTIQAGQPPLPIMPQLDGLRAVAVCAVFLHHTPWGERFPIPLGGLGVRLFFVLSGFLITSILLQCRAAIEEQRTSVWFMARQFYIRRFLRIFPLYYLVIAGLVAIDFENARTNWLWLVTYTTNIQFGLSGEWNAYGHFWSLAVEEHYYLVWPWLVLLMPRHLLSPATLAVILVGPVYKLCAVVWHFNEIATYCATPACLDTLGLGSLLALYKCDQSNRDTRASTVPRWTGVVGLVMLGVLLLTLPFDPDWRIGTVLQDVAVGLVCVDVIGRATVGYGGFVGRVLESGPLTYLGRISYGLYVYHVFVPYMLQSVVHATGGNSSHFGVVGWCLVGGLSIAIASVSWFCFERPLNNLKRYFPYSSLGNARGHR